MLACLSTFHLYFAIMAENTYANEVFLEMLQITVARPPLSATHNIDSQFMLSSMPPQDPAVQGGLGGPVVVFLAFFVTIISATV